MEQKSNNLREPTHSIEDLEKLTGFDRRKIAYYRQKELLPKIGRLGPKTRYPSQFLYRLLFIKRLQDMRDEGLAPDLTLDEIRGLLETIDEQTIKRVALNEEDLKVAWQWADTTRVAHGKSEPMMMKSMSQSASMGKNEFLRMDKKSDRLNYSMNKSKMKEKYAGKYLSKELINDFAYIKHIMRTTSDDNFESDSENWVEFKLGSDVRLSFRNLPEESKVRAQRIVFNLKRILGYSE